MHRKTQNMSSLKMSPCLSIQVILGGGRQYMFPKDMQDPEYPTISGDRNDGRNLVQEWMRNKTVHSRIYTSD